MKEMVFDICGWLAIFSGSNNLVRMRHAPELLGESP